MFDSIAAKKDNGTAVATEIATGLKTHSPDLSKAISFIPKLPGDDGEAFYYRAQAYAKLAANDSRTAKKLGYKPPRVTSRP